MQGVQFCFRLFKLKEDLSAWAVKSNCTPASLDGLLAILIEFGIELLRDSHTLLKTPRKVNCIEKCGGQYIYYGIHQCINNVLSYCDIETNIIHIIVNIDGLPLFKPSSQQLWPI